VRRREEIFTLPTLEHLSKLSLLHPHRPRQIRRRDDAFALDQLGKCFRRTLERDLMRRLQADYREHLPADRKHEIVPPFHVFRRAR
jgi:hypothetical protein